MYLDYVSSKLDHFLKFLFLSQKIAICIVDVCDVKLAKVNVQKIDATRKNWSIWTPLLPPPKKKE